MQCMNGIDVNSWAQHGKTHSIPPLIVEIVLCHRAREDVIDVCVCVPNRPFSWPTSSTCLCQPRPRWLLPVPLAQNLSIPLDHRSSRHCHRRRLPPSHLPSSSLLLLLLMLIPSSSHERLQVSRQERRRRRSQRLGAAATSRTNFCEQYNTIIESVTVFFHDSCAKTWDVHARAAQEQERQRQCWSALGPAHVASLSQHTCSSFHTHVQ
jgi:hypothetical protein